MDYSLKEDLIEHFFDKIKSLILPSENNNYKLKFLQSRFLLYCAVLLLTLKFITTLISINVPANIFFADITKLALENSVNQTRQSVGLAPLAENTKLDQAAAAKAKNMVQDDYFNHTSPTGVTPWFWFLQAGYNYKYAGENLAVGFYDSQEVYNAWLNSPSHKANIVNPNYTEVGTAILNGFGGGNTIVVVQEFGSQLPGKTTTVKTNATKPIISTNTKPASTQVVSKPTTSKQVASTPAANTQTTTTPQVVNNNNNGQVLSQSTQASTAIVASNGTSSNSLFSKVMSSALYNSDIWLQDVIYGLSLIVIGILLTLIFFNFNINFRKQLIFRAVLIVGLLSVATLLNKEIILSLIPHQIFI